MDPILPLRRNRNYHLLWTSQALSELGAQISVFALPLLVLQLTGSAAYAGLVGAVSAVTRLVVLVPTGALVDRWNRKHVMLVCEAVRVPALAGLAFGVTAGAVPFACLLAVAVIDGTATAMFAPAEEAALPQVVAEHQLSTAVAANAARGYLAALIGPGAAGFLLAAGKALPFLANAAACLASCGLIGFVRLKAGRSRESSSLVDEIRDGFQWIWRRPVIRAGLAVAAVVSVAFNALYLIVLTIAERAGMPAGRIGAIGMIIGASGVVGALAAPFANRVLSPRTAILGLSWLSAGCTPLLAVVDAYYLLGAVLAILALAAPTVQTGIVAYQISSTPDRLRGRVSAALGLAGGAAGAAGPLLGGGLIDLAGRTVAVLTCAGILLLAGAAATFSRALRSFTSTRPDPAEDRPGAAPRPGG
ncbi:MFS transporter [Amycolatopsis sp. NPDC004079]|uniref:MFS transporter n=1 Tax=Amycolatopsis sp. NPDC004079 TaxID=3154549 RepID=UPI0033BD0788